MTQFVDQVSLTVRSGDGGNGLVAWRREKYEPLGGPAGGNGGRGGSVILVADPNLATLIDFRYLSRYEAKGGTRGGPKGKHGANAKDLRIAVPVGTLVKDQHTGQVIADLIEADQQVLVAEGGRGGRGNAQLTSSTRRAPHFCEPGEPGIERQLELELKLLADVGIVGLPNAGKSSLLSIMTAARPKIADYPFSTLEPNLGVVRKPNGDGFVLADIPGLIKGASRGAGLGHKFLRHIERTRLLIHLVDASAEDILENIKTINEELSLHGDVLKHLPQLMVLNKADLLDEQSLPGLVQRISSQARDLAQPLVISCATRQGIDKLLAVLSQRLDALPRETRPAPLETDEKAYQHPESEFTVERRRHSFKVISDRVDRLVAVTNMKSPESLHHLYQVLRALGVVKALLEKGAQPGSEVTLGGIAFTFGEDMM